MALLTSYTLKVSDANISLPEESDADLISRLAISKSFRIGGSGAMIFPAVAAPCESGLMSCRLKLHARIATASMAKATLVVQKLTRWRNG